VRQEASSAQLSIAGFNAFVKWGAGLEGEPAGWLFLGGIVVSGVFVGELIFIVTEMNHF
jgi:hypothetical protein